MRRATTSNNFCLLLTHPRSPLKNTADEARFRSLSRCATGDRRKTGFWPPTRAKSRIPRTSFLVGIFASAVDVVAQRLGRFVAVRRSCFHKRENTVALEVLGSNRHHGPRRPISISVNFLEQRSSECMRGAAAFLVVVVVFGASW